MHLLCFLYKLYYAQLCNDLTFDQKHFCGSTLYIVEKVLDVDDTTKAEASTVDTSVHLTILLSKLKVLVKSENG